MAGRSSGVTVGFEECADARDELEGPRNMSLASHLRFVL